MVAHAPGGVNGEPGWGGFGLAGFLCAQPPLGKDEGVSNVRNREGAEVNVPSPGDNDPEPLTREPRSQARIPYVPPTITVLDVTNVASLRRSGPTNKPPQLTN